MRGHKYAFNSDRLFLSHFLFDHLAFLSYAVIATSRHSRLLRSVCLHDPLRFRRHLAPSSGTHVRSARRCHPSRRRWRWGASFAEASHVLPMLFLAHSNPTCTSMSTADSPSPSGHTHIHSNESWVLGLNVWSLLFRCVLHSSEQVKGAVPGGLWD